jgi:predicted RNase H-like HicB family nuclease
MIIEIEKETDGRWIAEIPEIPGVLVYATSKQAAIAKAESLALRIIAERIEQGDAIPDLNGLFKVAV